MIDPTYGNPADDYPLDDDSEQPHPCYVCHGQQVTPGIEGHACAACLGYWSDPICLLVEQDRADWRNDNWKTVTLLVDIGGTSMTMRVRFAHVVGDWLAVRHEGVDWHIRRERIAAAYVNK